MLKYAGCKDKCKGTSEFHLCVCVKWNREKVDGTVIGVSRRKKITKPKSNLFGLKQKAFTTTMNV